MAETQGAPTSLASFLESTPIGSLVSIVDLAIHKNYIKYARTVVRKPEIQLHCDNPACNALLFFNCINEEDDEDQLEREDFTDLFLRYRCRNCQKTEKTFAIRGRLHEQGVSGDVLKVGEWPPFGPPTPARVITLVGPDRELYLTGRRAESQGMGIGAFAYYRRVVENQKNRILEEIIRVCEKTEAPTELVTKLKAAVKESQFSKAMESVKDAVPEALFIERQNPLTLLHRALSRGLHAQSDQDCLETASSVRIILTKLADRSGQLLKDEEELHKAVASLRNVKSSRTKKGSQS